MKNKTLWVIIAVVVALVVWWVIQSGKIPDYKTESGQPTYSPGQTPVSGGSGTGKKQGQPTALPGGTPVEQNPQAYSQLVIQYEGRRIEFDESCQMRPADISFKNGTVVMFDNRSPQAKTIKIGNQSYNLPAYGYRFLTMAAGNVPVSLKVGCDNVPEVGKILLQANILEQY
ncbi:MAG: hypothetical protein AAB469_00140 [Patescibacteria group bacterium]